MDAAGASADESKWTRFIKGFERIILVILMLLLMAIVTVITAELAWLLVKELTPTRQLLLDVEEIFELFGFFLLVLIGVELITTLKVYLGQGAIHGEVVLEVALIAVAQKVIVMNVSRASPGALLGLAALIVALAAAFWSVRMGWQRRGSSGQ
jgi:uncharacterized membrane protein (DUF373 family)